MCDEATGTNDSQSVLDEIDRANLFVVPLDDQRQLGQGEVLVTHDINPAWTPRWDP